MSEERYILKKTNTISSNYHTGERVYDTLLRKELYAFEIVDLLNSLAEERDYWKELLERILGKIKEVEMEVEMGDEMGDE